MFTTLKSSSSSFKKKTIYVETIYQCCGYCDNMYVFYININDGISHIVQPQRQPKLLIFFNGIMQLQVEYLKPPSSIVCHWQNLTFGIIVFVEGIFSSWKGWNDTLTMWEIDNWRASKCLCFGHPWCVFVSNIDDIKVGLKCALSSKLSAMLLMIALIHHNLLYNIFNFIKLLCLHAQNVLLILYELFVQLSCIAFDTFVGGGHSIVESWIGSRCCTFIKTTFHLQDPFPMLLLTMCLQTHIFALFCWHLQLYTFQQFGIGTFAFLFTVYACDGNLSTRITILQDFHHSAWGCHWFMLPQNMQFPCPLECI